MFVCVDVCNVTHVLCLLYARFGFAFAFLLFSVRLYCCLHVLCLLHACFSFVFFLSSAKKIEKPEWRHTKYVMSMLQAWSATEALGAEECCKNIVFYIMQPYIIVRARNSAHA